MSELIEVSPGIWTRTDEVPKEITEREWRDGELLRTDRFVVIPDYPADLLAYRAALREYPNQPDFPDGTRPTE